MLTMASVVIVQGLIYQDGGLLVMGANVVNMGLLTVLIGYAITRLAQGGKPGILLVLTGVAAWLSVIAGALATSLELWLSGSARLDLVVPAMLSVHAMIGIGEALITVAAVAFLLRTRPDLLKTREAETRGERGWVAVGLLLSASVVFLAPFASANPDGLERVASDLGFLAKSQEATFTILPDYTLPLLGETSVSTILAGIAGVLVVAAAAWLLVGWARRETRSVTSKE
jgi:cobalt/nickel transport system permease protein